MKKEMVDSSKAIIASTFTGEKLTPVNQILEAIIKIDKEDFTFCKKRGDGISFGIGNRNFITVKNNGETLFYLPEEYTKKFDYFASSQQSHRIKKSDMANIGAENIAKHTETAYLHRKNRAV